MLNIVCVEHGDYCGRGRDYVNLLADMVRRSLYGQPYRFVCYTDNLEGLNKKIIVRPIPEGLGGWWAKLYLFAPGQFEDGDRVIFIDLDTVIMGGMTKLAEYDGEFCLLRDFYRPDGYGSGLMAWRAGFGAHIWESYVAAGMPQVPGGDQAWIEQCVSNADTWQSVMPGFVVSYKADVRKIGGAPEGAAIVCFHGEPKPHNCDDIFIGQFWKPDGAVMPDFKQGINMPLEDVLDQARQNITRDLPWLMPGGFPGDPSRHAVLVGGGPSLRDTYRALRRRKRQGEHIWALNNTHDWLIERNIIPNAMCMLDSRPENAAFVRNPHPDVTYYIAATCHPSVFDALKGFNVVVWFGAVTGLDKILLEMGNHRPWCIVEGGNTVGTKAMFLAYTIGYRALHLYGFDSSYRDGENHAYRQVLNDGERATTVTVAGKEFYCAFWMAAQANCFKQNMIMLGKKGCQTTVHGDGLIPFIYRKMIEQTRQAA